MTLDEIAGTADRWLTGDTRACVLALVEHVRALTPAPPQPMRSGVTTCCMGSDPTCKGGHPWRGPQDEVPAPVVEPPASAAACACAEYWPGQGHPPDCPTNTPPAPVPARAEATVASAWDGGYRTVNVGEFGSFVALSASERDKAIQIINLAFNSSALASAREEGDAAGYERGKRAGLEEASGWCDTAGRLQRADAQAAGEATAQRINHARADELLWAAERLRSLIGDKP